MDLERSKGVKMDNGQAQIHRSLTRPVLPGGAERAPAIINATTMLGIGLGPGFHWPNILLGAFLGTAVHSCCAGWPSAIRNSSRSTCVT